MKLSTNTCDSPNSNAHENSAAQILVTSLTSETGPDKLKCTKWNRRILLDERIFFEKLSIRK